MLPPWTPDLPALDLLLSVAELGSVGRAADAHRISQPSASARLARLERQLGVAVLVRTTRGSTLTSAGEVIAAWARTTVDAAHGLTDGVLALRASSNAKLRIAASLTIAEYLMPTWLLTLRRVRPSIDIAVVVANSRQVCELVRTGSVDLGFVEMPTVPAGLNAADIGTDLLALVVAARYPLAARAPVGLRPVDLLELPLLLREPGSGTRDTFLDALAAALGTTDPALPHAIELGSTTTIVATARAGGGVGVVSAQAVAAELAAGTLVEVRVQNLDLHRELRAIWLGRHPAEHARELVRIARKNSS
ncbi:MAG: LysR family transcriptional regulator [Jatrophihabitantaceae bacterium]